MNFYLGHRSSLLGHFSFINDVYMHALCFHVQVNFTGSFCKNLRYLMSSVRILRFFVLISAKTMPEYIYIEAR